MGQYLQKYIDGGLFHIDGKDERVGFLENASTALVEKINADKLEIVRHTLLLLGPTVASDDGVLEGVENLIKDNGFKTIRSIYPTRSLPMIRAVVLDALSKVIADNSKAANLVWLTGSDLLRFIDDEKQKDLIFSFFQEARAITETLAIGEWASSPIKPTLKNFNDLTVEEVNYGAVDVEALTDAFAAAAGPSTQEGVATEGNRYWPQNGHHQNWAYDFSKIAGPHVGEVINQALLEQAESLSKAFSANQNSFRGVVENLNELFSGMIATNTMVFSQAQKKSQLLWWKEALFSPTFLISYREMSEFQACLALAKDLSDLVGTVTPLSMDYFLRECVYQVIPKEKQLSSIQAFCESASSKEHQTWIGKLFPNTSFTPKRLFGDFAKDLTSGAVKIVDCESNTGISPKAETSLVEFAVWHFHYLQLQKNLSSK